MNNLILVRHSLPEIVSTVPAKEWRLSQSGKVRCKVLAEKLASCKPDVIISSTEPKAIETAKIVAFHLNKTFSTFEGLHEHDRTGVSYVDKDQFEIQVKDFLKILTSWFLAEKQPTNRLKDLQKHWLLLNSSIQTKLLWL